MVYFCGGDELSPKPRKSTDTTLRVALKNSCCLASDVRSVPQP
jgi:hypothetical protein